MVGQDEQKNKNRRGKEKGRKKKGKKREKKGKKNLKNLLHVYKLEPLLGWNSSVG